MLDVGPRLAEQERERVLRVATDLCYCAERLEHGRARAGDPPTTPPGTLHEAELDLLEPLFEDDYELVGTGAGRCVLRCPPNTNCSDQVVKLARFGDDPTNVGISQNRREAVLWTRHGSAGEWPLLPVSDYHETFRWLTMPYGQPIADRAAEERRHLIRQVQQKLAMFPGFDLREVRAENIVLVDGEPFLADYGRPDGY